MPQVLHQDFADLLGCGVVVEHHLEAVGDAHPQLQVVAESVLVGPGGSAIQNL